MLGIGEWICVTLIPQVKKFIIAFTGQFLGHGEPISMQGMEPAQSRPRQKSGQPNTLRRCSADQQWLHPSLTFCQQRPKAVKASKQHVNESKCSAGYVIHSFAVIFFPSFDSSSSQARKIVESHPYVPMAARKLAAEKALAKRMVRAWLSQRTFFSNLLQAGGDLALQENLKLTNARIEELNHRLSHMSAGMDHGTSDYIAIPMTATPPLPSEQITAPNGLPIQLHPATPSVSEISTSAATSSSVPTRTIILGDGTELTFMEADVGSPPLTGFADDVAGLNKMWDDTTPNWGGMLVLEIKGHPIPIIYWKDVYINSNCGSPWKPRQWHGMKSKWFNWKVSFFLGLLMLFCL